MGKGTHVQKGLLKGAGLAAVILLAPGGFILGATLLARRYHRARSDAAQYEAIEERDRTEDA